MTRKSLKIEYKEHPKYKQYVMFRVSEQTHRYIDFNKASQWHEPNSEFKYKTHGGKTVLIKSTVHPQINIYDRNIILYVRGKAPRNDWRTVEMTKQDFMMVCEAILAYNQKYNKNKLEMDDVIEKVSIFKEEVRNGGLGVS